MTTDSQSTPSPGVKPGRDASFDVPLMAKALGGLFMAGGTLALLTVLLPHTAQTNEIGLLLIVGDD